MRYQKINFLDGTIIKCIEHSGVESFIPLDESNRHYQEYLQWVAEGNEPEVINNNV